MRDDETGVTLPFDLPVDTLVDRTAATVEALSARAATAVPSTVTGKE